MVFGSRFLGGPHRVLFFRHSMGNRLLTFLSNLFTDLNLTDMETCYKVFRTDVLKRLHLASNRFGIEPEITAKVARLGVRVYEVPISYHGREYWEGKKIGWKDGVAAHLDDRALRGLGPTTGTTSRLRHPAALRQRARYNDWMWSRVAPSVGDRVLEVGAGTRQLHPLPAQPRARRGHGARPPVPRAAARPLRQHDNDPHRGGRRRRCPISARCATSASTPCCA